MQTAERESLVTENINLTYHIAKKFYHPQLDHDDLAEIGLFGLIKAANSFKEGKGKFSTFAGLAIQNEILREIRSLGTAKRKGVTYSLEEPIGDGITLGDTIHDNRNFEHEVVNRLSLYQAMKKLDSEELYVIVKYFGLFGEEPITQKEIAKQLRTYQTTVRRVLRRSLLKLRYFITGEIGE